MSAPHSPSLVAPRYPLEGVVSWNLNTHCNYRCTYCTQQGLDDRTQQAEPVEAFLAFFARLTGDWEVKLSGGEPTRHPRFLDVVRGLAAQGRRVGMVTNLSSPREDLAAFAEAVAARPGLVSASLHLEYADPERFFARAAWLAGLHRGGLVVTTVATRAVLPRLGALRAAAQAHGVTLKIQPEKRDRDVIDYTVEEREQLLAFGGHNGTGQVDPDLSGRPCWAGARYFILDHRGEAWRCYPARRYKTERLGNALRGDVRLSHEARPCLYRYCNCTVPQQRGMVAV